MELCVHRHIYVYSGMLVRVHPFVVFLSGELLVTRRPLIETPPSITLIKAI